MSGFIVGFCMALLVQTLSGFTILDWQWWVSMICLMVIYFSVKS